MKKQLILVAVFSIVLFGFGSLNSALAIGNVPIDITSLGDEVGASLMASSDLEVDNVGTLPTSPLYFVKQWGRGVERFFTFGTIAKAQLELNITNQVAAELLEVQQAYDACAANALGGSKSCKPGDKIGSVKTALQNFTNAQERLNARVIVLELSEPRVTELLSNVDAKTVKHVALLEQLTQKHIGQPQYEDIKSVVDEAQNNTLKTFTFTVGDVETAPTGTLNVKQKAEEQIKRAGVAIEDANSALNGVATTRGINVNPGDSDARGSDKVVETIDEQSSIFDRWGNLIAKAKGNLDNAKKAFAEGKYGEAYGQARSAEAIAASVKISVGDIDGDGWEEKIDENESPRPSDKVSPPVRPTPDKADDKADDTPSALR